MTFREFVDYYLDLNISDYPNIGIDLKINLLILAFMVGMVVTIIIVNIRREGDSQLIKKLIRYNAFSEESAKTVEEIKANKFLAYISLSGNGRYSKIIKRVGAKEYTYEEYTEAIKSKDFKEEKIDLSTAKIYIPEEHLQEAQSIKDSKNTSPINTILLCIIITIISISLIILMPNILSFIDNLLMKK